MGVEFHSEETRAKMRAAWVRRRAALPDFWDRAERAPSGCWLWPTRSVVGYGTITVAGRAVGAHRRAYELARGPIPAGMTLDHLCRVRACVNPDHLEIVTLRENVLRGIGPSAVNAAKETCKLGHPFDEANTRYRKDGRRECRTCANASWRRRHPHLAKVAA